MLAGFNVDLARAVCLEIGAACDIKVRPWDELLVALKRGDADAVIAAHAVTAKALAKSTSRTGISTRPGASPERLGETKYEVSPDGLEGVSIGVAKGTAHEAFLRAYFRDSKIVLFENPELAREALQQGKTDLLFDDGVQPRVLAQRLPRQTVLRVQGRALSRAQILWRRSCHRRPPERSTD